MVKKLNQAGLQRAGLDVAFGLGLALGVYALRTHKWGSNVPGAELYKDFKEGVKKQRQHIQDELLEYEREHRTEYR